MGGSTLAVMGGLEFILYDTTSMPEKHYNVVEYYKTGTAEQRKNYKDWVDMLEEVYDDKQNKIGPAKLYKVLKALHQDEPDEYKTYPTKRFIRDYLTRQEDNQIRKQTRSNKSDVIRSITAPRPNHHLQVDYLYFFWAGDGVEDERGDGPIDEERDDQSKQSKEKTAKIDKLFKDKKIKYRGAIVAIDVFSKYGYVEKIEGNINSEKAWEAMDKILKKAHQKFGKFGNIRLISTDKGSEFMKSPSGNGFKENLQKIMKTQEDAYNDLSRGKRFKPYFENYKAYGLTKTLLQSMYKQEDGKKIKPNYFFKHMYGYEGRSNAQAMVERLNKTLKNMTMKALPNGLKSNWYEVLEDKVIKNYNTNHHSVIDTSPEKVSELEPKSNEIEKIEKRIKDNAIRHGNIDRGVYKVGDFVRIKIFKPKKLGPKYTFKGGLSKVVDKDYKDMFEGVFVVHSVTKGQNHKEVSKQTTYRIVANWSHESKIDSLPSGQTSARAKKRIDLPDNIKEFTNDTKYPEAAYGRNFTKSALSRVPSDSNGLPISEGGGDYVVEKILSERVTDGETE